MRSQHFNIVIWSPWPRNFGPIGSVMMKRSFLNTLKKVYQGQKTWQCLYFAIASFQRKNPSMSHNHNDSQMWTIQSRKQKINKMPMCKTETDCVFLLKTMCWDGSLGLILPQIWLQHCKFWDRGGVLLWVARISERGLENLKDALWKHGFSLHHYNLDSNLFPIAVMPSVVPYLHFGTQLLVKKQIITNTTCYITSVFLYERSRLHRESKICQTTWLLNVSVANMQQL